MIIANTLPSIAIHTGNVDDRLSAKSNPVSAALPSLTVTGSFIAFCQMYSVSTAAATQATISIAALYPKLYIPTMVAGISARKTSHMILFVEDLSRTCGDDEIFNKLLTFSPSYFFLL